MKIYIELVIVLNILLDYMILYGTKRLLKRKVSNKRLFLGSLIGGITVIFLYIKVTNLELILIKIILSLIINLVTFGKYEVLKNTLYFYLISTILGGSIYLINLKLNFYSNLFYLLIIFPVIITIIIKEYKKYKSNIQDSYKVTIKVLDKIYNFDGFIDTGNNLKSPISNKGIILIDQNIPKDRSFYIPYKALNYEGLLEIIKPDKITINEQVINSCLIGISKDKLNINGYNCILPNILKEEL